MRENGLYKTDNLYVAAALLTEGKTLLRPERNGIGRILFVFRDDGDLQRLTERFWASELRQPVNMFANHWRDLRKLISNL
jgi:hypothetical protein